MQDYHQYEQQVYQIIGAAFTVHHELGWGLLEPIYNEALHHELLDQGIPNQSEVKIECFYKQHKLNKYYFMDLVVGNICVELKTVTQLETPHRLQLMNYLRLTKMPIGLLINFGDKFLSCERYAYIQSTNECKLLDKHMNFVY